MVRERKENFNVYHKNQLIQMIDDRFRLRTKTTSADISKDGQEIY